MFYCDALINATNTCNKLREQQKLKNGKTIYNKLKPLIYEELAYYSQRLDLINNIHINVRELTELIRQQQENIWKLNEYDFIADSKTCFTNEQLDYLLELTLQAELELFPDFLNSEVGEADIRAKFEQDKYTR